MVYCRGSGRVRFLRGPFGALLARMAALRCFAVAIGPLRFRPDPANQTHLARHREPSRRNPCGVQGDQISVLCQLLNNVNFDLRNPPFDNS